jgi:hypothetical protein
MYDPMNEHETSKINTISNVVIYEELVEKQGYKISYKISFLEGISLSVV